MNPDESLIDEELRPNPDAGEELGPGEAEMISDEDVKGSRLLLIRRAVTSIELDGKPSGVIQLACTFQPAHRARFVWARIALRLTAPAGATIADVTPRIARVVEPAARPSLPEEREHSCEIQGSGEGSKLALWDFSENPHGKAGLGHEHVLSFTVPVTGAVTGTVSISARLARPGIAGGLEAFRDLVLGPNRSERLRPVTFEVSTSAASATREAPPRHEPQARAPASQRSPSKKRTLLFLAANPTDTGRLALDLEARAIREELLRSRRRDDFVLETYWAAEPLDLLRGLREHEPTVLHFSGHGTADITSSPPSVPTSRDVEKSSVATSNRLGPALFLHGPDGKARAVSGSAVAETVGAAGSSVKVVFLNACYSEALADALLAHVECIIGMNDTIDDSSARAFSTGFYGGVGAGASLQAAFQQGRAAISLQSLPDGARPQLRVRDGVDASQIFLAAELA